MNHCLQTRWTIYSFNHMCFFFLSETKLTPSMPWSRGTMKLPTSTSMPMRPRVVNQEASNISLVHADASCKKTHFNLSFSIPSSFSLRTSLWQHYWSRAIHSRAWIKTLCRLSSCCTIQYACIREGIEPYSNLMQIDHQSWDQLKVTNPKLIFLLKLRSICRTLS